MGKVKLDNAVTSTRPDLTINMKRKPGAFIIKNGAKVPDLTDTAMKLREEKRLAEESPKPAEIKPLPEESKDN